MNIANSIIAIVRSNPMITTDEIVKRLMLPKNDTYRLVHELEAEGEIHWVDLDPQHRGWEVVKAWPETERTLWRGKEIQSVFHYAHR